jgi:hypothetical protein
LQTNGTNREQYYTAYFARNYTRYGQYNVSVRCYNELSANVTHVTRNIRRSQMNKKQVIHKSLLETSSATRFYVPARSDYSYRHVSCLILKDMITDERMKLISRKNQFEVIPSQVS